MSFAAPKASEARSASLSGHAGRTHLPALDGVRGLAILLVLFYHGTVIEPGTPWGDVLHGVWRNFGWCGVDLFFVLSGFLITGILLDAKGRPNYLRNFYARRVLRIFPLYYAYLLLALVVGPAVSTMIARTVRAGDDAWAYWLYLQNWVTAWHGDWSHGQFLDHLWSLAIEEQFYVVWPFVVLACSTKWLLRTALMLPIISLACRLHLDQIDASPIAMYVMTHTRLDGLALGAAIVTGMRLYGADLLVRRRSLAAALLACSVAIIIGLTINQGSFAYAAPHVRTWGLTALAVACASLLSLVVGSPNVLLDRAFNNRFLRMLGRYSYALYVFHFPINRLVSYGLARLVGNTDSLAYQLLLYAMALPLSLLAAALSWHLFESRILRLKRRFE